jgi:hypothetical protein
MVEDGRGQQDLLGTAFLTVKNAVEIPGGMSPLQGLGCTDKAEGGGAGIAGKMGRIWMGAAEGFQQRER